MSYSTFAYEISVTGKVTDVDNGSNVINHEVFISIDSASSGGFFYNNIVTTDVNGIYRDTIQLPDTVSGSIIVGTVGCGIWFDTFGSFSQNITNVELNLEICTDPSGNSCQAYYDYYPDMEPMAIQFYDLSYGWPTTWHWNFGDGTSSFEQSPLHYYQTEGDFIVTLTIEGDSCYSEFESVVWVSNDTIGDCQANYFHYNIPNTNTIEFYDASIGIISSWSWDFGDNTFSYEQNPIHTYSEQGIYYTSLTIVTIDSCFNTYGEYIYVGNDTTQCNAEFSYELDTLNNTPHTYLFTDQSEGDIESWYWDFGDGTISYQQNPIHVYNVGGSYDVCLTITGYSGGTMCSSTNCYIVSTTEYYNFGGQAFINDYPINIDSSDIENIGIAYLYRKINNSWEYMDQREFWQYGYYWFANKPIGDYIIMTELKESSLNYNEFAPAYHLNSKSWKNASVFTLSNNQQFAINVSLSELAPKPLGIGSISGKVSGDISCGTYNNIEIEHILVQLFDQQNNQIAYTYTDEIGFFEFSELALTNYTLKAEYPGRYSTVTSVSFTDGQTSIIDLDFIVYCTHILDIHENTEDVLIQTSLPQPNPTSKNISFTINSKVNTSVDMEVLNLFGEQVYQNKVGLYSGKQQITIDLSLFQQGSYILNISSLESNYQKAFKIFVIH